MAFKLDHCFTFFPDLVFFLLVYFLFFLVVFFTGVVDFFLVVFFFVGSLSDVDISSFREGFVFGVSSIKSSTFFHALFTPSATVSPTFHTQPFTVSVIFFATEIFFGLDASKSLLPNISNGSFATIASSKINNT